MIFNKHYIVLSIIYSTTLAQATSVLSTPTNVYHQIMPLITKKINVSEPTDIQKNLLNGSVAFLAHGSNHSIVQPEVIHAIASIDFFTDILPRYFQTNTVSGTIQTALLTAQMTDNLDELAHRQSIIKYFNNHPELLQKLDTAFQQSKSGEDALLSLFTIEDVISENWYGTQPIKDKVAFTSEMFKSLNNKYILGGLKRLKQLDIPMIPTIITSICMVKAITGLSYTDSFNVLKHQLKLIGANSYLTTYYIALIGISKVISIQDTKQDFDIIYDQQKQLINVVKLINQMKKLSDILNKNSELQTLFPEESKQLKQLFKQSSKTVSNTLKYVLTELQSSSFQGEASYCFSKQGTILATHYHLSNCKAELIPYLEAFGIIDAYISVAKLYQKYQTHPRVTFCLPEFVNSATPVLDITDYWHPLIDPNIVVTNSLNMGHDVKNLMITGPNAGGKTTSLMSLMINIIFAQSFGIAPSTKLVMTPFAKIHSYLDITTNLQEGLSLFAAEVDRAKKLKQSILSCTANQKTFTIIDEIFSGTAHDIASDIGSKFAIQLGNMKHSMTIITTHFKELTKVGQDTGTFTNYKVADATIMPDGKIVYPFKLIPGISSQNIAQHMLEQQDII